MAKTSKPKAPKAGAQAPVSGRPTHVVLRIIQGAEGGDIYAGTPEEPVYVDACDWANAPLLEQSGHLRRITPEECDALEAARPKKEKTSSAGPDKVVLIDAFITITEEGVEALLHRDSCECVYEPPAGALRAGVFNANSIEAARRTVQRFATDENGQVQPDQNRVAATFGNCLAGLPPGSIDQSQPATTSSPVTGRPAEKSKALKTASKRSAKPKAGKK